MVQQKSLLSMFPLFLVLFIDGMGLGLLFPLLNSMIIDPASVFLPAATSIDTRDLLYGLVIGVFMISWFFGAAILGDLSDMVGRKKSLLICLAGAFLGYLISAFAVIFSSLSLLFLGRIIAGFTGGSQAIAQAAIVDVSDDAHKARNIGLILLAVSLGFVFGPVIGGVLSNASFVSWFNFTTPFYFASIISLLNAGLLWWLFKETFHVTGEVCVKLGRAIEIFVSAFKHEKVWELSVVLLVMIFGWSNYFSYSPMFMLDRYDFDAFHNAMFLAVLGIGFSVGCGVLVDFCAKRFRRKYTVMVSLILTGLGAFITWVFDDAQWVAWVLALSIGITMAVAYSTILVMFSNQAGEGEQGWVMGVTGSIMALCFGITTFFAGFVAHWGAGMPLLLAFCGLTLAGLLMKLIRVG